jgi:hypothetical protein
MKKLKTPVIVSFLAGLIFLSGGCSAVRVIQTETAPGFSLSDYSTFNFYEVSVDTIGQAAFINRIGWIEDALKQQFVSRGVMQSGDNPDLLVNIGLVFAAKTQTRETDVRSDAMKYIGNMNYAWESETVAVRDYTEGTFVMHLVNAKSKVLVWEGIAETVAVESDSKARKNIDSGSKLLFRDMDQGK